MANHGVDLHLFPRAVLPSEFTRLYSFTSVRVQPVPNIHPYIALLYNMNKVPFSEPRVRQALDLVVDRVVFAEALDGISPQYGPIPPGAPFHIPTGSPMNKDRANRLLDEAGYPRGQDGKRFSILIENIPGVFYSLSVLQFLRHELSVLGIEVQIHDVDSFSKWTQCIASGNYHAALRVLFGWHDPIIGIHRMYDRQTTEASPASSVLRLPSTPCSG